ncbi:calmodulin-binding protein 60 B-like [Henckelia pumila]|uniref:calmodulin-binding protein 60 B-like n=1 Tax=Henckelia pumila TaxID=405737 RepID=UPI003C6E3E33
MEADRVYNTVEDKFRLERIETGHLKETKRMVTDPDPTRTLVPKNMELRFSTKISQPTLTCHELKGEGNTSIEVALFDSSTGKKIVVGAVAFANVELVVLSQGTDDCTEEGFNEKIVTVEGKKFPLLTASLYQLQGGSCVLEGVTFRHHATKVKPTEFRLGARIVGTFDGIIVKEAKTESFPVKCYRKKYSMKKEIPNLTDKVSVLKNIQLRGPIEERLQDKGINTVEKFLIRHQINPQQLKNISGLKGKKWESTLNHARKCQDYKMYWYFNSQENSGVVFDFFGKLQWMYSQGEYAATNMLSKDNKVDADKLLLSAFEQWGNVVTSFDDLDSVHQHLEAVKTTFHQSNSLIPGQYPVVSPGTGASEMIDGSNNMEAPDPISDSNSLSPWEPLGMHDYRFGDFHSPFDQCFFSMMHTYFDIGGEVSEARIDGTGSAFAESREAENDVLRIKMDLNRKKITSEANPAGKKQKIC